MKCMCVSFPRSGHHLLVRGLFTIAPELLVYSENYRSPHNMGNCEFVNFQKDHDLDLSLELDDEMKLVLMNRDPIPAIKSWHKMLVYYEGFTQPFDEFFDEKMEFYQKWVEKWIMNHNPQLVIEYDLLIKYPVEHIMALVELLFPVYDFRHNLEHLERWANFESTHPNSLK